MVVAHGISNHLGGFLELRSRTQPHLLHGVKDAPMNGFQSVADIGQSTGDDNAHGVFQIRLLDLFGYFSWFYAYSHKIKKIEIRIPKFETVSDLGFRVSNLLTLFRER